MGLFSRLTGRGKPAPKGHRGTGHGGAIGSDEAADALGGEPLFVSSSNVAMVQYHPEEQSLMVEFHSGHAGVYSPVSEAEMRDFIAAPSKGTWVIEHCIGRENLKGHACWNGGPSRKAYRRLR